MARRRSVPLRMGTSRCAHQQWLVRLQVNSEAELPAFSQQRLSVNCANPMPGTVLQPTGFRDARVARPALAASRLRELLFYRAKKDPGEGGGFSAGVGRQRESAGPRREEPHNTRQEE